MKKAIFFILLVSPVYATPTVSTVTGTIQDGQSVAIGGSGFGSKSPAKPFAWFPFDSSSSGSSLGVITAPTKIENMAWSASTGYNGGGGMQGTAGNGVWTFGISSVGFNWNDLSQKWHVMRRTKQNYIVPSGSSTNNQKNFRVYPANQSNVSNFYWSIHNGRYFVENIGGTIDSGFWGSNNPSTTNWIFEEIIMQASSANGVKDGLCTYRVGGTQFASGNLITRSDAAPASWALLFADQAVIANKNSWTGPAWSTSNNAWFDDIYVDNTWQRAIIGDASTYANCRKFGIAVPTAWTSTSITATLSIPTNDFPPGTTAYAYVFDTSNTPNTAGKQIVIGGSVAGNPAPTVTAVAPSTGVYSTATVSTATGTGFLSGITVTVGTMSATSVVLNSATSVRFTMPYGPASRSGLDLRVDNTDGQFAVLTATMGYTTPVVNQAPFNVSAGDDWTITLPATSFVSGSADDDGLPSATLTYLWQKKTGPGTVTFGDSTALTTTAVFSSSGTYTLSLTANDSALSTESPVVTVTVNPVITTTGGSGSGAGTGSPTGTAFGFTKQP